jgi:hypothetical protein
MKAHLIIFLVFVALCRNSLSAATLTLVSQGKANAVIVCESDSKDATRAAGNFQKNVARSTGVTLPILKASEKVEGSLVAIRIGDGPLAASLGMKSDQLEMEQFRVKTSGNNILIVGRGRTKGDQPASPLVWGTDYLLDQYLGVRWLWPGDLGTHVPRHHSIQIPDLDVTWQPVCEQRELAMRFHKKPIRKDGGRPAIINDQENRRITEEGHEWGEHQRLGGRTQLIVSHSFSHWWNKYSAKHPEWFAKPPPGAQFRQPYQEEKFVKLCNSNPEVIEQMIKEWKQAGSPDIWGAAPNDGAGFCTCEGCLAMDEVSGKRDREAIFRGKEKLTIRHVKWWNRIMGEFRKLSPNIRFKVIAYSAYKSPPPVGFELDRNFIVSMVIPSSPEAKDDWMAWQRGGASVAMRPNWWHAGTHAPYLLFREQADITKFAMAHKMVGFRQDELKGSWGVQGLNFYTFARLNVRPELTVDQIVEEYLSAFGSASGVIREYIQYWDDYSVKAGYPWITGGYQPRKGPSLYDQAVKKHKVHPHPLNGSFKVLQYLYTDEVMAPAFALLDKADQAAQTDSSEVRDRIQFLRDGLRHTVVTRQAIELGYEAKKKKGMRTQWLAKVKELENLRRDLSFRHVVWGYNDYGKEVKKQIPTVIIDREEKEENTEGI